MGVKDGDSIQVRQLDGQLMNVRYLGVYAPEQAEEVPLGIQITARHEELVGGKHVWLEVALKDGEYLRDRDGRVLAFVFLDEELTSLVQLALVEQGLAVHHLPGLVDSRLDDFAFQLSYSDQLIEGQIGAVITRQGIWSLPALHSEADVVVAAVRYWGNAEVVYIVNRGPTAIDLAHGWVLVEGDAYNRWLEGENPRNRVDFSRILGPECMLASGAALEVRSGGGIPPARRNTREGCGSDRVILNWFGYKVWENDGDAVVLCSPDKTLLSFFSYPEPWKNLRP